MDISLDTEAFALAMQRPPGRVVYDEPSVMAETPRSQVGPVAITGDDQQIRVLASLDNLAFHAT